MATDINVCTFSGHVVADPDLSTYGDNKTRASFRLAVNNYGDKVAWLRLTAFNGLAEKVVGPFVKKGSLVMVTCSVETRDMEGLHNATGDKVNRTDVSFIVRDLKLTGSGSAASNSAPREAAAVAAAAVPPPF